jgi:hypothetical protein
MIGNCVFRLGEMGNVVVWNIVAIVYEGISKVAT